MVTVSASAVTPVFCPIFIGKLGMPVSATACITKMVNSCRVAKRLNRLDQPRLIVLHVADPHADLGALEGNMRIVSWNVQSLTAESEKIVAAVLDEEPSLIALQEYPSGPNAAAAEVIFAANGFVPFMRPAKARPFRTIVFAPQEAQLKSSPPDLAENDPFWVDVEFNDLGVSAAHIAIPKNVALREMHWRTVLSLIETKSNVAHIVIGDLNTTRHGIDQVGDSIAGDHYLRKLEAAGWTEAWRATHAAPARYEYSWYYKDVGFRFDQAWLSPVLAPHLVGARMNHAVREQGLSDHSMLIVELNV